MTFTCFNCKAQWEKWKDIQQHLAAKGHVLAHECQVCDSMFISESSLDQHMKTAHAQKHYCRHCDCVFIDEERLQKHNSAVHYECPKCKKLFATKTNLEKHQQAARHEFEMGSMLAPDLPASAHNTTSLPLSFIIDRGSECHLYCEKQPDSDNNKNKNRIQRDCAPGGNYNVFHHICALPANRMFSTEELRLQHYEEQALLPTPPRSSTTSTSLPSTETFTSSDLLILELHIRIQTLESKKEEEVQKGKQEAALAIETLAVKVQDLKRFSTEKDKALKGRNDTIRQLKVKLKESEVAKGEVKKSKTALKKELAAVNAELEKEKSKSRELSLNSSPPLASKPYACSESGCDAAFDTMEDLQ